MFKIDKTRKYLKQRSKLKGADYERIVKFERNLRFSPFSGKPLGFDFLREKKFNGKRLLFMVYSEYKIIKLVP